MINIIQSDERKSSAAKISHKKRDSITDTIAYLLATLLQHITHHL